MTPIGGFREGEVNGKPFHIFNFLSETETPSSDDFPPLYVCPSFCMSEAWSNLRPNNPDINHVFPADVFPYPYFFNKRSGDQQFQFLIGSDVYDHPYCVYHPYVIRISRHCHRISFTSSLPPGKWPCGVCRRKVDHNYGAYSCNKCDDYFVHTKCALRENLWDGKELEGIPEEPEIVVEPFERISDRIILHFTHDHHLKLEISGAYDEGKFCQACILPIYEGSYYSCMDQCDFILHEVCANAPCKKQHECSLTCTKG
ncbi:unnamed protein product [Thlaspi arvense]|uniref:DC1 domain-containing protein n=1 Tax=Thlaspi arvense TaxID=13288 RepID=A0AAU9T7Q1_THLAR|nr:unnamed protein product [Thlaspi arvense]